MPNYQNNMRYGRQGTMRQPCGNGYGMHRPAPQAEPCCNTANPRTGAGSMLRGEDACCTPALPPEPECCTAGENTERRGKARNKSCGCRREDPLYGMPLTMAYVPWQTWGEIYDVCKGFRSGTVFEELDKPFVGRGGWK